MKPVKIDIVSDLVCPWCYIGRKRLADAITQLPEVTTQIQWQPFELFPQLPATGVERQAHMAHLFGSTQKRDAIFAHVAAAGRQEGLDLRFDGITVSPNTANLHRLLWKTYPENTQDALANALFHAFFTQLRDLSQPGTILELMQDFGWSAAKTQRFLESNEGRAEVKASSRIYQQIGVRSVPFYVIDNKLTISGAQPTSVFMDAIQQAAKTSLLPNSTINSSV